MSNFNIDALRFQIASEVRVNQDGQAVFSVRAVGRITGVSDYLLRRAFSPENISTSKLAQTLIQYGFEGANISAFRQTGVPDTAVAIITAYYATMAGERCTGISVTVVNPPKYVRIVIILAAGPVSMTPYQLLVGHL